MKLHVRLTPKAACEAIDGWALDDQGRRFLKVRVRAAPIEGRANAALVLLMAKTLGIAKSRVVLSGGETARLKTLTIDGIDEAELETKVKG